MTFQKPNYVSVVKHAMLIFACIVISSGCASTESDSADVKLSLYVDPADHDFSENPKLLERILASPHGYFRFINIVFSNEVCNRFNEILRGTPSFNLHGDAHIEQYAVTDLGRGLTDFDDSSGGPAIIDLMRFGVSLHLTSEAHGWKAQMPELFDAFLAGYRAALKDPAAKPDEPSVVTRMRSEFKFDRQKYFEWIRSIMLAMPESEKEGVRQAMLTYTDGMYAEHRELPERFFEIVDIGYLRMGIGSALDLKYLARVRGQTDSAEDDVILEMKQVRDLSGIACITITQPSDPFRVLIGQSRIAYEPYKYLGYIRHNNLTFWIHAWVDNYEEFGIGKSAKSIKELAEVAYDIGVQLGRGHTNQIAAPLDQQLRRAQLGLLNRTEANIKKTCIELANETVLAWQKFRTQVNVSGQFTDL